MGSTFPIFQFLLLSFCIAVIQAKRYYADQENDKGGFESPPFNPNPSGKNNPVTTVYDRDQFGKDSNKGGNAADAFKNQETWADKAKGKDSWRASSSGFDSWSVSGKGQSAGNDGGKGQFSGNEGGKGHDSWRESGKYSATEGGKGQYPGVESGKGQYNGGEGGEVPHPGVAYYGKYTKIDGGKGQYTGSEGGKSPDPWRNDVGWNDGESRGGYEKTTLPPKGGSNYYDQYNDVTKKPVTTTKKPWYVRFKDWTGETFRKIG